MTLKVDLLTHQVLQTPRLRLRPFQLNDAPALFTLGQDPAVAQFSLHYPNEAAAVQNLADYWMGAPLGKWAVTLADGSFIGAIELHEDEVNRKAELGYVFDHRYWGHGYATEAARALLDLCFNTMQLTSVFAMYDSRNSRSGALCQRLGMHVDGQLRADRIIQDVPVTTVVASILRSEYDAAN